MILNFFTWGTLHIQHHSDKSKPYCRGKLNTYDEYIYYLWPVIKSDFGLNSLLTFKRTE